MDDLTSGYKNTLHSSIGMKPVEARKDENSGTVWYNLYGAFLTNDFGQPKFKIGVSVRISKYKTIFAKGYLPNFTEEIFQIKQIIFTKPIVYQLEDYHNEPSEGYFYTKELSYVSNPENIEYKIEKILRYKTIKSKKLGLVKYKGWDSKFNEWLPVSSIKNTKWLFPRRNYVYRSPELPFGTRIRVPKWGFAVRYTDMTESANYNKAL